MLDIKFYGTETPSYQLAKSKLTEILDEAGIGYNLEEVNKITSIIHDEIKSVPAVKVNNQLLFEIKQNGHYNSSLREAIQSILKIKNYGNMLKIIVPTDFSEVSLNAYNFANHLAKELTGIVLLTHVYYPTSTDINQFVVINEEAEKIHREKLNNLVKSFNQDWLGSFVTEPMVEGVFRIGFPRMELSEMSKDKDTILVMGTTGEGDAFKKIFGSLSLDMIDNAHCPLFLVPPSSGFSNVKEVTYLSEDLKNDTVHLLYVGRLCAKMSLDFRLVNFHKTTSEGEYDISNTIKIMESYFPEVRYHIDIIDTNDIFTEVKDLVTSSPDNLIVLSTKHRNIFQNLFHKSLTEFAATHSISPLLILSDKSVES